MSDPMTRTDIEDVLSSIRRLVSEETRPEPAVRPAPAPSAAAPAADAGRLVLTPALRVAGRNEAPEATEAKAPPVSAPPVSAPPVSAPAVSAPPAGAEDWLPESAAPETLRLSDRLPEDQPEERPEEAPAAVTVADAVPEDTASEGMTSGDETPEDRIGAKIAGLEAAVAARSEQWDPEGTEEFDVDDNHSDAFGGPVRFFHRGAGAQGAEIEDAETLDAEPAATGAEDVTASDGAAGPAAFHSKRTPRAADPAPGLAPDPAPMSAAEAAAPEAAADVWAEEAAAAAPEPAGTVSRGTAAEPAAEEAQAAPGPQQAAPADDGLFEEGDAAFLDEESLRDVVREIIRQELQGTLGERITRNVRKLVRAEINRALASRDFE